MLSVRYGPGKHVMAVGPSVLVLVPASVPTQRRVKVWAAVLTGGPVADVLGLLVQAFDGEVDRLPDFVVIGSDGASVHCAVRGAYTVRAVNPESAVDTGPRPEIGKPVPDAFALVDDAAPDDPQPPEGEDISGADVLAWAEQRFDLPRRLTFGQVSGHLATTTVAGEAGGAPGEEYVLERGIAPVGWFDVTVHHPGTSPMSEDGAPTYASVSFASLSAGSLPFRGSASWPDSGPIITAVPAFVPLRKAGGDAGSIASAQVQPDSAPGSARVTRAEPAANNSAGAGAAPAESNGAVGWQQAAQQWQQQTQGAPAGYYGADGLWYPAYGAGHDVSAPGWEDPYWQQWQADTGASAWPPAEGYAGESMAGGVPDPYLLDQHWSPAPNGIAGYAGPEYATSEYGAPRYDAAGNASENAGQEQEYGGLYPGPDVVDAQGYGDQAGFYDPSTGWVYRPIRPVYTGPIPPGPVLPAVLCADGHANPPHADECRLCGRTLDGPLVPVERPPLGRMWISDGQVADLFTGMLIGRSPEQIHDDGQSLLVTVPSPQHDISRTHVEVRLEGWHVLVVDLNSRNGTEILRGGHTPLVLSSLEPTAVHSGDIVRLGDAVTLTFEDIP